RIRLWEIATGQERRRFVGHPGRISCIAFAPHGQTLVTGSDDTTALVWDLSGRAEAAGKPPLKLSDQHLQTHWSDLGGQDSGRAHKAMMSLAGTPRQALLFLKERLPPVPVVEERKMIRLIADLGNARYAVRKQAMEELTRAGEAAEPVLRKELPGEPAVEVRRRIQQLLHRLEGNRLCQARALELLELLRGPEAHKM